MTVRRGIPLWVWVVAAGLVAGCGSSHDAGGGDGLDEKDAATDATGRVPDDPDEDGDGVEDGMDRCPAVADPEQLDTDKDTIGDACDNCPDVANVDQADGDDDGTGDECSLDNGYWNPNQDTDRDGAPDLTDNCRTLKNTSQADTDNDGVGNECDNCPDVANATQDDLDGNKVGDACEVPPDTTPMCADETAGGTVVTPSLYFVIDTSGSMEWAPCGGCNRNGCSDCPSPCNFCGTTRWAELKSGLDTMAATLTRDFNVGIGTFPEPSEECSTRMPGFERLDLRIGWTAEQFKAAYAGINPVGRTPAQQALDRVRDSRLYQIPRDPIPSRPKAVVFITDGQPNCNGDVESTAEAAARLYAAGIPVYVIGFSNLNAAEMDRIAEAGRGLNRTRGNDWFPVSNRTSIINALRTITRSLVSCTVAVELDGDEDTSRMRVETIVNGAASDVPYGEWSYNPATRQVTLLQSACEQVQSAASSGKNVSVRVRVACATECTPAAETCDYVDNDCDGDVDEDCTACPPEICDGKNNDCDELVDEGCPGSGLQ